MAKNNIVLYEPEIPQNSGNIMRTCAGTDTALHFIKPLGFSLDESKLRRSAVNYFEHVEYYVYENWQDFLSKNVYAISLSVANRIQENVKNNSVIKIFFFIYKFGL